MTNSELTRIDNIIKSIKVLIPNADDVKIGKGVMSALETGALPKICFWLYVEGLNLSISFWKLADLESYVLRKIHAFSLLQVSTPTPEQRRRKIALKHMCGNFEDSEKN